MIACIFRTGYGCGPPRWGALVTRRGHALSLSLAPGQAADVKVAAQGLPKLQTQVAIIENKGFSPAPRFASRPCTASSATSKETADAAVGGSAKVIL